MFCWLINTTDPYSRIILSFQESVLAVSSVEVKCPESLWHAE